MKYLFPATLSKKDQAQSTLLQFAALFLLAWCIIYTLSPAVRLHTWLVSYPWLHWIGFAVWLAGFSLLHRKSIQLLPDRDPFLLPITALLSGWGMLTVYRLNSAFGLRQTVWLAFCVALVWLALRKPGLLGILRRYKYVWLTGGLLLTTLTFFFGTYPAGEGPRLWLGFKGVYLQPSEPLKLLLIIYLAAYLADRLPFSFNLVQLLLPGLVLVIAALVILLAQRDLGTTSLFILLYFFMIYLTSGKRRVLLVGGILIFLAGATGYFLFDIIRARVDSWINPWLDTASRSYQIIQSMIAIGAGGVFGNGPGLGNPGVIPVAMSDFIFSAIAEETGLLGSLGLVALLVLLTARAWLIAVRAPTSYQRYLAIGLSIYIALQSILIIGGNIRLLPLTGVTLPFVSYGGSSLMTSFLALLILLLISNQQEGEPASLPNTTPYKISSGLILAGFAAITLLNGWWAFIRSNDLQNRPDNPRNQIADRYELRGRILDRQNQPIVITNGKPGSYTRETLYPPLGHLTGYTHGLVGMAGLEYSLNGYLRGLEGNPSSTIWWHHLLYGTPPAGVDVRLSIDLQTQRLADELMGEHQGALVLVNAQTGEILAMVSHPTFDPNLIDQKWETWRSDERSPLLNRVVQGQYPPGTALAPFLLAAANQSNIFPTTPKELSVSENGKNWECAKWIGDTGNWSEIIQRGCPGATLALGNRLGFERVNEMYRQMGLFQSPSVPLATAHPVSAEALIDAPTAALGSGKIRVSPLQMALAAAALSGNGVRPLPTLTLAVLTSHQGWVILPASGSQAAFSQDSVEKTTAALLMPGSPLWGSFGNAQTDKGEITWYLSGTAPGWKDTPLALALVLEEDNPLLAQQIGSKLLKATLNLQP